MDEAWDEAAHKELLMDSLELILHHESDGSQGTTSRDQLESFDVGTSAGDFVLQIDQNNSADVVDASDRAHRCEARILADVHLIDTRKDELFVAYEALKANGFLPVPTRGCPNAQEVAPGQLRELGEDGEKATSNILVDESEAPSREQEDIVKSVQYIEDPQEHRTAKRLARNRLSARRARERAKQRLYELEFDNRRLGEENRQLKQIVYFLLAKMRYRHGYSSP